MQRPCCTPSGGLAVCPAAKGEQLAGDASTRHDSQTLSPPGLEFECEGSLLRGTDRPVVRQVFPRFAPRSGGATVTVFGENLGIDGAHTILRVHGRPVRSCTLVPVPHCANGFLDFDEENVDCGGAISLLPPSARGPCRIIGPVIGSLTSNRCSLCPVRLRARGLLQRRQGRRAYATP
jgi:hypothetical protein